MSLSIVIVSHNSLPFLHYCLDAAMDAMKEIDGDVILVDNNSNDHSVDLMQKEFPALKVIANNENPGFGKACNQGWRSSSSDLVLFLNPDCIISSLALENSIRVFKDDPQAGALGVQMITGRGDFLPESKRGMPGPMAGFFKLTGIASIFSTSNRMNAYYEPAIQPEAVQPVPVLSGAYMMVRRKILEQTGGFDERYFMYAEDIDLSLSIQKSGFKNIYLGSSTILHFKGTSTPKNIFYLRHFYTAMRLFVKKYWPNPVKRMVLLAGIGLREKWAAFRINTEIKKNSLQESTDWYLEGDPSAMIAARVMLEKDTSCVLRSAPVKGSNILLCIGKEFGYGAGIRFMKENRGFRYRLYKPLLSNIIG